MGEILKKFGRYYLLDLLAQGGMAEIYRARLSTSDGVGRLLVIKRIMAGYGTNREFVQMFRSEIKVTLGFNHPNIVQLYDFGEEEQQPYIAMEYVDGKNLRQLLNRYLESKQAFPVPLAVFVMEQAAAGLYYAHHFRDKISGEAQQVVHRDISPQNLIVSFDGMVKIIDFGIAKARSNSEQTRAGIIKGKPSYLAPEQISGDTLDGRCDLFALGAVFWEILTGRKLFQAETDLAVLKLIEACESHIKPPSTFNPAVTPELDQIILKMLQRDPEKRYKNGEELQKVLRKFLVLNTPDFSTAEVAQSIKELFYNEMVEDRKLVQKLNDKISQLTGAIIPEMVAPEEEAPTKVAVPKPPSDFAPTQGFREFTFPTSNSPAHSTAALVSPAPAKHQKLMVEPISSMNTSVSRSRTSYSSPSSFSFQSVLKWTLIPALMGGCGYFYFQYKDSFHFENPMAKLRMAVEPTLTEEEKRLNETSVSAAAVVKNETPEPTEKLSSSTKLRVHVIPFGMDHQIWVNGERVVSENGDVDVSLDKPISLKIERPGYAVYQSDFVLSSNEYAGKEIVEREAELKMDSGRSPAQMREEDTPSEISVDSIPSADAKIYVNGKFFRSTTAPFKQMRIPAGKVTVDLRNSTLDMGEKKEFNIEPGQSKKIEAKLRLRE